jgi:hypothetical protein
VLDKVLSEYAEKFEDNFPLFYVRGMEESKIIELVKQSIKEGVPYEAEYDKNADY